MSLYNSFDINKLFSELETHRRIDGVIKTPTELRNSALQNLTGVSDIEAADFASFSVLSGISEAELQYIDGSVAANNVDSKAILKTPTTGVLTPGTGVSAGVGFSHTVDVQRIGAFIYTKILVDLTGLTSADSDLDVIGIEDTANPCHIGQITTAVNGAIIGGSVRCVEVPSSLTDIGIYCDADGTLVYEDAIASAGDGETVILAPAVQAVANGDVALANMPVADEYLYLVNGANDTPDDFTAGQILIELVGLAS